MHLLPNYLSSAKLLKTSALAKHKFHWLPVKLIILPHHQHTTQAVLHLVHHTV